MIELVVFAEAKAEVRNKLKANPKLKGKIYHLQSNEDWELSKDGILYLDVGKNVLPSFENYAVYDEFPISEEKYYIPISTHKHIHKKCKCYVSYLPSEQAVAYLKTIAKETKSIIGIGLEHERGDNLYDIYCWVFDYREHDTSDFNKGYKQISNGVNFYPAARNDLLPPKEFMVACYESDTGYDNFHLTGCPAKVKEKWEGVSMEAFHKMNELFGIKKLPYWVDLRKYELGAYKLD